jgi:hypothetical protein
MTVCCAGTLEFVESLVEDVYIRHSLLPFNEMAQEHRAWGLRVGLGVQMLRNICST